MLALIQHSSSLRMTVCLSEQVPSPLFSLISLCRSLQKWWLQNQQHYVGRCPCWPRLKASTQGYLRTSERKQMGSRWLYHQSKDLINLFTNVVLYRSKYFWPCTLNLQQRYTMMTDTWHWRHEKRGRLWDWQTCTCWSLMTQKHLPHIKTTFTTTNHNTFQTKYFHW